MRGEEMRLEKIVRRLIILFEICTKKIAKVVRETRSERKWKKENNYICWIKDLSMVEIDILVILTILPHWSKLFSLYYFFKHTFFPLYFFFIILCFFVNKINTNLVHNFIVVYKFSILWKFKVKSKIEKN